MSCPEICHMDKIKVVLLAEPHNQVCLLSFVVSCDFLLQDSFIGGLHRK